MTKTKQAKETQNRQPIHGVMETVLQNAGIPKEIAANIVDTQQHMEEIDQTKRSIKILRAIHRAYKDTYEWCLNVFWDMEVHVEVLVTNSKFLNEPWFKENWKFLFKELLRDIEYHFDMYVTQCRVTSRYQARIERVISKEVTLFLSLPQLPFELPQQRSQSLYSC